MPLTVTNYPVKIDIFDVGARGPKGDNGADSTVPGPPGPQGNPGAPGGIGNTGPAGPPNTLAIGTVSTLPPGSSATSTITGAAPNQTLSLGIPQGADGAVGPAGPLPEAPLDGEIYGRQSGAWVATVTKTTYTTDMATKLGDAPSDGNAYGRLNGAWATVT